MTGPLSLDRRVAVVPSHAPGPRLPRMGVAALVSVGVHAALIGVAVLWWLWPAPHRRVALVPLQREATVQMVMSPPGGLPSPATTAKAKVPPAAPKAAAPASKAPPLPPAPTVVAPLPAAAPAQPTPPPQAPPSDKLTMNFPSLESDTNALVSGAEVVPASPDIKYHNRKPSYPLSAAMLREQGAVLLLVHVRPDGFVGSVDVLRSSGYLALDHAALDAVRTWHFLPAIRNGEPVSADVLQRIVFGLQ